MEDNGELRKRTGKRKVEHRVNLSVTSRWYTEILKSRVSEECLYQMCTAVLHGNPSQPTLPNNCGDRLCCAQTTEW